MYNQRRPVPMQTQMQPQASPQPQPQPSPRQHPLPSLTIQTQPPIRSLPPPQFQQPSPQFQPQPPRGRAPYEEVPYGRSQSPRHQSQPRAPSQNRSQNSSVPPSSGGRFPPRKSSLSQTANPAEAVIANMLPQGNGNGNGNGNGHGNGGPSSAPYSQSNFPTPAQRRERASSNVSNVSNSSNANANRPRTGTNPDKALPFIRPADIYKRIAEERERKRRESLESSNRDSMDEDGRPAAATVAVAGAAAGAAAVEAGRPRARLSSESLRGRTSTDDEGRRGPGKLDTVAERKSEYGFDNFLHGQGVADADIPPTPPAVQSVDKELVAAPPQRTQTQQSIAEPQTASSVYSRSTFAPTSAAEERSFRSPTALPEINRFGDFGEDFLGSSFGGDGASDAPSKTEPSVPGESLRHNPSTGMRSVVNTAFDTNASPTSDSSFQRSDSNATSNISPIVGGTMLASLDKALGTPSTIKEEPAAETRISQDSATIPGFVPGHRRDLSTPSPGNSPARHARIQSNDTVVPKSELAEVSVPSPTTFTSPSVNQGSRPTSFHEAMAAFKASGVQTVSRPSSRGTGVASPLSSRANSPTKGRVRDLAGQFETKSRSPSPEKDRESLRDVPVSGSPTLSTNRPMSGGRMDSFRPALPGGWVSYVTNAPSSPGKESPVRESPVREVAPQNTSPRETAAEDETPIEDVSSKAFAAVAAAGVALAGALTVVGAGEQSPSNKEATEKKSPTHGEMPVMPPPTTLNPSSPTRSNRSSFAPPSPPPKDTPRERSDSVTDYFPAPIALRPKKSDTIATDTEVRESSPASRPRWVSSLSSETNPADMESDRLRKEIMRSLSPGLGKKGDELEDEDKEAQAPKEELLIPTDPYQSARRGRHESKLIPSEYDTYWQEERPAEKEDDKDSLADSDDSDEWDKYSDDEAEKSHTAATAGTATAAAAGAGAVAAMGLHQPQDRQDANRSDLSIISEGSRETEKSPTSAGPVAPSKPPAPARRFSWEEGAEDEPIEPAEKQEEAVLPGVPVPGTVPISIPEEVAPVEKELPPIAQIEPEPVREPETSHSTAVTHDEGLLSAANATMIDKPHPMIPTIELSDVEGSPMPSPRAPGSPVVDSEINRNSSDGPEVLRLSGDGTLSGSGDEGKDVEALTTESTSDIKGPSPKSSVHFPSHLAILSFKEILAMQKPRERVAAFDTARSQHATAEQDALKDWLNRTLQDKPEHNTLLNTNYNNPDSNDPENQVYQHRNLSVRKFPKISSLSSAVGGGMGHTRSPSGSGGLSSVRMEAKEKGRDLIHSAGVFGGKAGGAAKGFLAKGRSRFGNRGSEKVD